MKKRQACPEIFNINDETLPYFICIKKPCLLCGVRNIIPLNSFILNGFEFHTVRCNNDGMMWLDPQPEKAFYDYIYRNLYHKSSHDDPLYEQAVLNVQYDPELLKKTAEIRLNDIERFVKKGSLLEIGFGNPYTLMEAEKRGWETFGVEADKGCISALKKSGMSGIAGTIFDVEETRKFSVIVMYSVIEHIPDPVSYLQKACKLLVNEGLLVLRLPDTDASGPKVSLIAHLYHFNSHTIMLFLRKCGFEPKCIDGFGLWKAEKYDGELWNMNVYSFKKKMN